MTTETTAPVPPRRMPALHLRLLLPAVLLLLVAASQAWIEQVRRADRLLVDLLADQQRLALAVRTDVATAQASPDETLLDSIERTTEDARARLDVLATLQDAPEAASLRDVLDRRWAALAAALEPLRELAALRARAADDHDRIDELGAALLLRGDELLAAMERAEEPPDRMRAAGRQLVLAQRMAEAARQALRGESDVLAMADRLGRDAVLFGAVNNALLDGDPRMRLGRVQSDAAHDLLRAIGDHYRDLATMVETVMQHAVALYERRDAGRRALLATDRIAATAAEARATRLALAAERAPVQVARDLLAALTLVALLGAALTMIRERRLRSRELYVHLDALRNAEERRRALEAGAAALDTAREEAGEALRATLAAVREGNLGARCEPDTSTWQADRMASELATIAALNATLDTITERLTEARRTSRDVARAVAAAHDGTRQNHELSEEQMSALVEARPALAHDALNLDQHATTAADLARAARERASQGAAAADLVADAHARGSAAHDQLGAALRVAAQLAERGRELRDIVRLLDDLADEGRILALNAAIHASLSRGHGEQPGDAMSQAVQRLADGVAVVERRASALADQFERAGEDCVDGLRRAASGIGGALQLAATAVERGGETATELGRHAERAGAHAASTAALATTAGRHQAALLRVEQLAAVLQASASESDRQVERARELVELLRGHLAAFRLPAHEDANVVDLRDFLKRS